MRSASMGDEPPPYNADPAANITHKWERIARVLAEGLKGSRICLNCALVSRGWNRAFTPAIYREPHRYFSNNHRTQLSGFLRFYHSVSLGSSTCSSRAKAIRVLDLRNMEMSMYAEVPSQFLSDLLAFASHLERLDLSDAEILSTKGLNSITQHYGSLKDLRIAGLECLSGPQIRSFISRFPNLTKLNLSRINQITDSIISSLPVSVRHLNVCRCPKITSFGVARYVERSMPSSLQLSECLIVDDEIVPSILQNCTAAPPTYVEERKNSFAVENDGLHVLRVDATHVTLTGIFRLLVDFPAGQLRILDMGGIPTTATDSIINVPIQTFSRWIPTKMKELRLDASLFVRMPSSLFTDIQLVRISKVPTRAAPDSRLVDQVLQVAQQKSSKSGNRRLVLEMTASHERENAQVGMYAVEDSYYYSESAAADDTNKETVDIMSEVKRRMKTLNRPESRRVSVVWWAKASRTLDDLTGESGWSEWVTK